MAKFDKIPQRSIQPKENLATQSIEDLNSLPTPANSRYNCTLTPCNIGRTCVQRNGHEMNFVDIQGQFKKVEVFADGRLIREWEAVAVGDYPHFIVEAKDGALLWGHEVLEAIMESGVSSHVERLVGADRVVAEWMNGEVEVMTEEETKTFSSREGWHTYWRELDVSPGENDSDEPDNSGNLKKGAAE
ncbi:MAG: hypothetical protein J2P21_18785 [Chloracidobacterium sp.]|nr:hypothetical protein [Chloracidobacterium sp.]